VVVAYFEMKQHVLKIVVEGITEKVSQFIMPVMSIYNENFCLNEQKVFFSTLLKS
jgi:hypothetical protein